MKDIETFTNERLLSLLRSGDSSAFQELYRRNRNKVMNVAYRLLRDQEKSKEVTQEIFIKLWENRQKINPLKNIEGLLFVMVRSHFLDSLKRKAIEVKYLNRQPDEEAVLNSTDLYIDFKECSQIVSRAIDSLPKQAKTIYLLSRDKGWSHEKISEHMQISKKTVNNQITTSTRRIRRYFTQFSPETVLCLLITWQLV